MLDELIEQYFALARERYKILLRRRAKKPHPWTNDPIFQMWRFCNVHREDDKTTIWFRKNVREPIVEFFPSMRSDAETAALKVVLAESTLGFLWFNKIETGELIQDILLDGWDSQLIRERLTGVTPLVNAAYMVTSPRGYTKLEGIIQCVEQAKQYLPMMVPKWTTLQNACESLQLLHFIGKFHAYEIVSDLRHTPVLCDAPDINTWASCGPGAARGLGRLCGDANLFDHQSEEHQQTFQTMLQCLLLYSREGQFWPQEWPKWEMIEAERWCCEFDKYQRAKQGRNMKQRFFPTEAPSESDQRAQRQRRSADGDWISER